MARNIRNEDRCLTNDQARHIHKKVELGSVINIDTIKQEMDQDIDRIHDTYGEINPYCEIIVNKAERGNTILLWIEQWSILSDMANYSQHDRHPKNFYNFNIKTIDQKSHKKIDKKEEERQVLELDLGDMPEKLK